jgi:hypothetical protein
MDAFDFAFTLLGLLLGLGLAEIFGGFGRALQSRRKIRIGWLAPLLGMIVACDLTSFWMLAWNVHERIVPGTFVMLCGLAINGAYYLVARLTFPDKPDDWPDYNDYFFAHKRIVLAGVIGCNLAAQTAQYLLGHNPLAGPLDVVAAVLFYPSLLAAIWARSKTANIALLMFILFQYPVLSFVDFLAASKLI